jgi:zinc transport system permease protein
MKFKTKVKDFIKRRPVKYALIIGGAMALCATLIAVSLILISNYLSIVQNALIISIFVAFCAALIGVPLVLRRYSMIGFGLSNVAFAGVALGAVMGLTNSLYLILPLTIATAVLLLVPRRNAKIKGDAAIAILAIGALAIGFFLLNANFPIHAKINASDLLFGGSGVLFLPMSDVWIALGMVFLVLIFYIVFYNKIFAMTFDPEFSRATGIKTRYYEVLIATVIAIVVALSIQMVGSLMLGALIVFPALSAMRIFKDFKMVLICSGIIAVCCAFFGVVASVLLEAPVGATIVIANIVVFVLFYVAGLVRGRFL